jgi:outer membrane PBP1 activator LpoA protein
LLSNLFKSSLFGGMLFVLLQLTACAPSATRPSVQAPPGEAGERVTPKERLREYDAKAAAAATAEQRAYFQLLAMELLIEYGQADDVHKRLDEFDMRALDKKYRYRVDLLQAELALAGS